jgi:outer membrane cobalamin receptor
MFLRGFLFLILSINWVYSIAQNEKLIPKIDTSKNAIRNDTLQAVEIIKQRDYIPLSTTVSAQQLSSTAIENSNSLNVADAIKGFSGVQIRDYGGIGGMKTIDVRSLGSKHTAVFYDGIAINDAQSGEIDLSKFSLDNLQSISLYNNNHQDITQPAKAFASASTLYLQSRSPLFEEGKNTNLYASVKGGSFGLINPSLSLQQKISASTSLSLSSEWMKANGEYDFHYKNRALLDTIIRRKNTDIETFRIEAIAQGLLPDSSQWRVNSYAYFSERGLPGPAVNNKYYTYDRQWDKNLFFQVHWDKKVSDFYSLKVNGKYTYNWLRYVDPYYNERFELNNFYEQQEAYLSMVNLFKLSERFKAALSTDYFYNALDANLVQFVYPKRNTGLLNIAAEYHTERLTVQGNVLGTLVGEKVKKGTSTTSKTVFSPSVSFSYQVLDEPIFYVRGSYKSVFRMPTFNDSYYTLVGSTSLKPEYVKEFNVGFTLQQLFDANFKSIVFKVDAYRNDVKDKITAIPKTFRWTMLNLGQVEIMGLDLGVQGELSFSEQINADFSISSTFQKALDKTSRSNQYGQDIPYSPRSSTSFNANLNYHSWILSSTSQYSGGRYNSFQNIPANYMDDWFLQDFSLSYLFHLKGYELKLKGEVNNLANVDYVILENYPMPGRNYRLAINLNF